jgi:hypothetical protein
MEEEAEKPFLGSRYNTRGPPEGLLGEIKQCLEH